MSISPSKMPRLAAAVPNIWRSCSASFCPSASALAIRSYSALRTKRVGERAFRHSMVPPSPAAMQRCLKASLAELSALRANTVPICTPSAPIAMAASTCCPQAMPPAAMTGSCTAWHTAGMSDRVVVSSLPLCPPASKPSATMASTPACSHLMASLLLGTTCTTVMPASCRKAVYFWGLPAEVNTMRTCSSTRICIRRSISGYISGTFTPHGLLVAAFSL